MPKVYSFTILPNGFSAVKSGKRKFVIVSKSVLSKQESKPKVGDEILLQEETVATETKPSVLTGQICHKKITHILPEDESLAKGAMIISVESI